MFQQLWHSCLLLGAIIYSVFVMLGDGPCEKALKAAAPIGIATKIAVFPRFWTEAQRTSIQDGGDSAQAWFASAIKDTFYEKTLICNVNIRHELAPSSGLEGPNTSSIDPNAPKNIPAPTANPAGLPDLPKELK